MSILKEIPEILKISKNEYEKCINDFSNINIRIEESIRSQGGMTENTNMLVNGENLELMRYLINFKGMRNKIQLIYIDPPFFSKADYNIHIKTQSKNIIISPIKHKVYKDTWEKGMTEYLVMLCTRLYLMKDLLSERGSLFLHLDHHSVHYTKIFMDEIFGQDNFRNEIIWSYKSGGSSKKQFSKKHDTLLFYSKSSEYFFNPLEEKSYNRGLKPYRFKGVKEYEDEIGWYTVVNMKDVWSIDMVGRTSGERVEYATQKPEALIKRIIEACSKEGDICADFFGGSGTLAAVASKLKRKWITCDKGEMANLSTHKRLLEIGDNYDYITLESEDSFNNQEDKGIKIDLQIDREEGNKIKVSLNYYGYNQYNNIPCDDKFKEEVMQIMKEDSLELVAYWSIDLNYDCFVFKPSWYSSKSKNGICREVLLEGRSDKNIAIRVVDVFGKVTLIIH